MTWYRTGTVAVTNGSANVTLTGGNALLNIFVDDGFIGPDGKTYAVQSIGGSGAFTLANNYTGSTASGQAYAVIPVADYARLGPMLEQVNTLITAYQDIAVKAGVGLFSPGNAAAPGVRGIGFTGTGLVWNVDGSLSISIAGTIVATLATSGLRLKSSAEIARLETTTPRGGGQAYMVFADPTGAKAYLGYAFTDDGFDIFNALNAPIRFYVNSTERLRIEGVNTRPGQDNNSSIGVASFRWSEVFSATGTINTSDEDEKTWRGAPTKTELKAATRIIGELGFYRWNDAVADKTKDARYHFGVRAQQVWRIMAEEGLVDPLDGRRPGKTPYAFLCFDEWDRQTEPVMAERTIKAVYQGRGSNRIEAEPARTEMYDTGKTRVLCEAGNRFGVRTDQLIMFLMAAQEARLAALEERMSDDK